GPIDRDRSGRALVAGDREVEPDRALAEVARGSVDRARYVERACVLRRLRRVFHDRVCGLRGQCRRLGAAATAAAAAAAATGGEENRGEYQSPVEGTHRRDGLTQCGWCPAPGPYTRSTGVPRGARLRSHPSNLIRVMPAKGGAIQERAPAWGITPVPERLRTLGGLENGMLWSSLGLSLLVLVAGTLLVPALSLPEALLAILVGGIFGNALLGGAAAIGAEAGVPAMVLLRAPLGRAGSYLPTGLNVVQNLGWTIFEVLV